MTLTATQIQDLRNDLGDSSVAFTDPELDRNYERVSGAPNAYIQYRAALGLCWQQIMAGAAKYHDYEAGAVKEKLSQVYQHAKQMYEEYKPDVEAALSQKRELAISKIASTPHQTRTEPGESFTVQRKRRY